MTPISDRMPDRMPDVKRPPLCEHFPGCGGCANQDAPYPDQLERKQDAITSALKTIGIDSDRIIKRIIPSPKITGYRNRMDFVSFQNSDGRIGLGLRERGSWKRCVDIDRCRLMADWQDDTRKIIKEWQAANSLKSWDQRTHQGTIRYAVCRDSSDGKSRMASIVSAKGKDDLPGLNELSSSLQTIGVTSFFIQKNAGPTDVSNGEPQTVFGEGYIREKIEEIEYHYGPLCFFQPNPLMAKTMVKTIKDAAIRSDAHEILDLYCGVGLFTLAVAEAAKSATGVELAGESIEFARKNAMLNKIDNATFIAKAAEKNVPREFMNRFDTVIVDPPRSGLHTDVVSAIRNSSSVKTLIYSSCNPIKFVNDAAALSPDFDLETLTPLDMFPHTPHFEAIGVFKRKNL